MGTDQPTYQPTNQPTDERECSYGSYNNFGFNVKPKNA